MVDISKQKPTYQIEPLRGEKNYELWSIRMSALLLKEGLAQYIKIVNFSYSAVIENETLVEPDQNTIKAEALIKLNLFDGLLLQVRHISKPYKVWKALENLYSPKGFSSEFPLCKELFDTTLEKLNNKMELYLNQVKRLYDQLTAKNVIIPEKVIFAWVLNNLSPNYETLITTITQSIRVNSSSSIKLEELFSNLIDESKRLKHRDSGETALYTTKQKSKYKPCNANKVTKNKSNNLNKNLNKSIICEHCRKKGHKIEKCWSNIEEDLDTCLDNSNETDLVYWSFPRKCMKSMKNVVFMIFMLFLLTAHSFCKCEFKNLCRKHEYKIEFPYFYKNF